MLQNRLEISLTFSPKPVGGTSGIGESTAREVVRYTGSPTVYIVGRSQTEADRITAEFKELNSKSKVHFIRSDVSLLRNVDKVCDEIKSKEKKINLLVLTPGILTLQGRTGKSSHISKQQESQIDRLNRNH
jgi:short-subunit dehydrogenase